LDIGALTVDEIALSIAAELIAVRRGITGRIDPMSLRVG
jgi:xanthine/CO dehydrogenase XdhC/CoxF family maturation factor